MTDTLADLVRSRLRDVADFPSPGILFKDVTPVLADAEVFGAVIRDMAQRRRGTVDVIAGIEARGFIFGAALALELGVGFVPVRKAGKLPGRTRGLTYDLEYGTATIEVHEDAFVAGARVLLVDDVLATGGTAEAACRLLEEASATVVAFETLVELAFLPGRARLAGHDVHATVVVT
ncbi:adenine phosphoribosyltransferase [Nostocoides sp. HKS02]|uniref:adenine phosphoribosyltransferase n=1 Tax=Nostocoides sp. HKS02 TaxID=1813880 RepID=UPI0012B46596|nr:adenine phosphoribosyltransferase [Tetrasphaera sp. HKS02]QGN57361.1 adenine phosphoribosyltransferase [Tetrasphaera sp. HKS02]